jgi:hypothetical protein
MARTDKFKRVEEFRRRTGRDPRTGRMQHKRSRKDRVVGGPGLVAAGLRVASVASSREDLKPAYQLLAEQFALIRRGSYAMCDGMVLLHIGVHVTMDEMSKWSPDRIGRFMRGIAQVTAAVQGTAKPQEPT